jgi:hypothetical protein
MTLLSCLWFQDSFVSFTPWQAFGILFGSPAACAVVAAVLDRR